MQAKPVIAGKVKTTDVDSQGRKSASDDVQKVISVGSTKAVSSARLLESCVSKEDLLQLLDLLDEARLVGSEQQFRQLIHNCSRLIPIDRVHVSVAELDAENRIVGTKRHLNVNFPTQWLAEYRAQKLMLIDPAARLLFRGDRPVVWGELRKTHRGKDDKRFFGTAAEFGLRNGFNFGSRINSSNAASFFTCEGEGLTDDERHIALIQYLLPHLHIALSKVHLGLLKESPHLTDRERDVLNWIKYGRTDEDVALQLGLSKRTVKFHIENAMVKLQANNRVQAVAIALSQGLIDW